MMVVAVSQPKEGISPDRLDEHLVEIQRLQTSGGLVGRVAHEMNNLLTTMLGNAALGKMSCEENASGHRCLGNVEKSAQRAAELIRELVSYTRNGDGLQCGVDLNRVINDTRRLMQVAVGKRSNLELSLASELPQIEASISQIRQALFALVLNAHEALPRGVGSIRIRSGVADRADCNAEESRPLSRALPGPHVYLEVQDQGVGISEDARKNLFQPFHSTKGQGRGIGLKTVLNIVEAHRGHLRIDSIPGQGTTIRMLFPIRQDSKVTLPTATQDSEVSAAWWMTEGAGTRRR